MENEPAAPPRRVRVEQNIYRRPSGVYEVGFKDVDGRKRWRRVDGGISAARVVQNEAAGHSGVEASGAVSDARLRFADAASSWLDD